MSNNFFFLQKVNCLVMEHIKINTSIWGTAVKKRSFFDLFRFRKKPSVNLSVPIIIYQNCSGITLNNTVVKSILFSTDLAVIENTDCDAILAVYPFAPSVNIMKTLISFTEKPVICGVGGGVTQGRFSLEMAVAAEQLGASAVIINQPFKNSDLKKMQKLINIPIIASVSTIDFNFIERFHSGADFFHITGGANTPEVIEQLQTDLSDVAFICTAGQTIDSLENVLSKNANAVVLTPPSTNHLFKDIMQKYRNANLKKRKIAG